jgi:acylphosphatase
VEKKLHYRIFVRGYVQGVGFRWSTARQARSLGINGFVRNMPDGSVYIEAEGSEDNLKEFIDWCKVGPGAGYVERVDAEQYPPINYPDFRIEH